MSELLDNIERFEAASAELREVIREAHSILKDLRSATRDGVHLITGIETAARVAVEERLAPEIEAATRSMNEAFRLLWAHGQDIVVKELDDMALSLTDGGAVNSVLIAALRTLGFTEPPVVIPDLRRPSLKRSAGRR